MASRVKLFIISNYLNTTILAVDYLHFYKRKWQSLNENVGFAWLKRRGNKRKTEFYLNPSNYIFLNVQPYVNAFIFRECP